MTIDDFDFEEFTELIPLVTNRNDLERSLAMSGMLDFDAALDVLVDLDVIVIVGDDIYKNSRL